jgi:hypothetical protein
MMSPYDMQAANSLASDGQLAQSGGPAVNALAQPYQPLYASPQNTLSPDPSSPVGNAERDRSLQFIAANRLALEGQNGAFLRALQDFQKHFGRQAQQS